MRGTRILICDKCNNRYDASPFVNMLGNGELAYSKIRLYGDEYNLCPNCTKEIHSLIINSNSKRK